MQELAPLSVIIPNNITYYQRLIIENALERSYKHVEVIRDSYDQYYNYIDGSVRDLITF